MALTRGDIKNSSREQFRREWRRREADLCLCYHGTWSWKQLGSWGIYRCAIWKLFTAGSLTTGRESVEDATDLQLTV